eukprot:scaffold170722_cov35-Attheya_sp.AAC.1
MKLRQNGEISLSPVTPRNSKNGFIKFDAVAMTALTVLQSCIATAPPSAEMGTGPPSSIKLHNLLKATQSAYVA